MLGRIRAVSSAALEQGTLKPIETTYQTLPDTNPPFLIRVLQNIARKQNASSKQSDPTKTAGDKNNAFNPFLPYEPSMYVQDLGSTHVLLLNKFNVVENHALIVTKVFEEQNSLLTHADMTALWTCLGEIRGVAFYNAGLIAGASQRHKHMQIVPTPLSPDSDCDTPFDNALHSCAPVGEIYASKQLRFMHAVMRMEDCARMAMEGMCEEAGVLGMKRYVEMMGCLEGRIQQGWKEGCRPFGYNLVVTRKWMMIVPRRRECYEGVSVNSLGFVGCLLVRDEEMLSRVRHVGGMQVLRETAFADSMDE